MNNARTKLAFGATPWTRSRSRHRSAAGRPRVDTRGLTSAAGTVAADPQIWDHDQEPDLDSLLADPLVGLVMNRDGLSPEDVAHYVHSARARLATRAA
jgi:hypothetical protein